MDADVAQRIAQSRANVIGHRAIERTSATLRGPDGRFDIRVNDASGQDPLAVAHPCHEPGEAVVADCGGDASDRLAWPRPFLTSRAGRRVLSRT
jgi:hypothetical protein